MGNVWGMDENAMKAAGAAANGVVFPVRTAAVWGAQAPGMANIQAISRISDRGGQGVSPGPLPGRRVQRDADGRSDADRRRRRAAQLTGERIRDGFYARKDWVPELASAASAHRRPSRAEDHRGQVEGGALPRRG